MRYNVGMPKETFSSLQRFLFLGVLAGVTALTIWVLWPFVMSVFWALVLAIVLRPIFVGLQRDVKKPSLAALLTIFITLLIVGVPLYAVGLQATREGINLYQHIASDGVSFTALTEQPYVAEVLGVFGFEPRETAVALSNVVKEVGGRVISEAVSIGAATADFVLKFAIMLYLLFFFLRDGAALGRYLQRIIPLGDERERLLFARFTSTTRAVVKGTLIVALAQGAVGALLFLIAGIGSPILWGTLMAFFAMIPAIGPFLIWLPAGIILLLIGNVWQALVVIIGGALIIGSIDNVLRPVLVGRDIQMPDALVLLAILGGIATFGLAGVIIGPVIGALFISIWDLFGKDFSEEITLHG